MILERELLLYAWNLNYARKLFAGIPADSWGRSAAPNMNTGIWLIGHLAICVDYGMDLLGKPHVCPDSWHRDFGPGSVPGSPAEPYPPAKEVIALFEAGHIALEKAIREADPAVFHGRHSVNFNELMERLPLVGDLMAHLLTTHEATHLGQFSAWRRSLGIPAA